MRLAQQNPDSLEHQLREPTTTRNGIEAASTYSTALTATQWHLLTSFPCLTLSTPTLILPTLAHFALPSPTKIHPSTHSTLESLFLPCPPLPSRTSSKTGNALQMASSPCCHKNGRLRDHYPSSSSHNVAASYGRRRL
jgi:hypothetical protein